MRCPKCLGVKETRVSAYHAETCALCDGSGFVNHRTAIEWIAAHPHSTVAKRIFEQDTQMPCLDCGGTGSVPATKQAEQRERLKEAGDEAPTRKTQKG